MTELRVYLNLIKKTSGLVVLPSWLKISLKMASNWKPMISYGNDFFKKVVKFENIKSYQNFCRCSKLTATKTS